jgi:hypothetical protein
VDHRVLVHKPYMKNSDEKSTHVLRDENALVLLDVLSFRYHIYFLVLHMYVFQILSINYVATALPKQSRRQG